jgi:hypothetical protein
MYLAPGSNKDSTFDSAFPSFGFGIVKYLQYKEAASGSKAIIRFCDCIPACKILLYHLQYRKPTVTEKDKC